MAIIFIFYIKKTLTFVFRLINRLVIYKTRKTDNHLLEKLLLYSKILQMS